jgi:hypothetical protein
MNNIRPDVHAAALIVLSIQHEEDRKTVLDGRDLENIVATVTHRARRALADRRRGMIVAPTGAGEDDANGWSAAVDDAGARMLGGAKRSVTLEDALPSRLAGARATAQRAAASSDAVARRAEDAAEAVSVEEERREHAKFKLGSLVRLNERVRVLKTTERALIVIEAAVVTAATTIHAGVLDFGSLSSVPAATWASAFATSVPAVLAAVVLTIAAARLAERVALGQAATRALIALIAIGLLSIAVAVAALRFLGTLSTDDVDDRAAAAGSVAALLIGGVGSLALMGAVAALHVERRRAERQLDEIERQLDGFDATLARLRSHRDGLIAERDENARNARLPELLSTRFEADVAANLRQARSDEGEVEEIVHRVRNGWASVSALSEASREALRAYLYVVVPVLPVDTPSSSTPSAVTRLAAITSATLAMLLASVNLGCAQETPTPFTVVVVCDGTLPGGSDACSRGNVSRLLVEWFDRALLRPDSRFDVVMTDASLATTRVEQVAVVPSIWKGDFRAARTAFKKGALTRVEALGIGDADSSLRNRSNLFAALLVAGRIARERVTDELRLVVESDGLAVGLGMNAEKRVPSEKEMRGKLKAVGVEIDLSAFRSVEVCGLTTRALGPGHVAARDRFVSDLLALGKAPKPTVMATSCTSIGQDVPAVLMPKGKVEP